MPPRRPTPDDHELPRRDDVDRVTRAADRPPGAPRTDEPVRLESVAFRPGVLRSAQFVAPALAIVGMLVLIPFIMTPIGSSQLERLGFGGVLRGWLVLVLASCAAAILAITVLRWVSAGTRRYARRDVFRLAAGDALAAGGAAAFVSFLVSGGIEDVTRVLTTSFVLCALFTWAMLVPLYRRGWDAVALERGLAA